MKVTLTNTNNVVDVSHFTIYTQKDGHKNYSIILHLIADREIWLLFTNKNLFHEAIRNLVRGVRGAEDIFIDCASVRS